MGSPSKKTSTSSVVGVDGAKVGRSQGWVCVALANGRFRAASFHEAFEDVLAAYPEAGVLAVDIPVGLVEAGERTPERAVRGLLTGQASSVFSAPARPVLEAPNYERACALSQQLTGRKISKQSWALFPRIREVYVYKEARRIFEVHPEASFRVLHGERLGLGKKTWHGQALRRKLLASAGIVLPDDLDSANEVPPDDVLDAAVCAWSAMRISRGEARSFPDPPEQLDGWRPLAIWA